MGKNIPIDVDNSSLFKKTGFEVDANGVLRLDSAEDLLRLIQQKRCNEGMTEKWHREAENHTMTCVLDIRYATTSKLPDGKDWKDCKAKVSKLDDGNNPQLAVFQLEIEQEIKKGRTKGQDEGSCIKVDFWKLTVEVIVESKSADVLAPTRLDKGESLTVRKKDKKGEGQRGLGKQLKSVCLVLLLFPGLVSGTQHCDPKSPVVVERQFHVLNRSQNCSNHNIALKCGPGQIMVCLRMGHTSDLAVGCAPNICINGNGCPVLSRGGNGSTVLQYQVKECGTCPGHYNLSDVDKYPICQKRKRPSFQDSTTSLSKTDTLTDHRSQVSTAGGNTTQSTMQDIPSKMSNKQRIIIGCSIGFTLGIVMMIVIRVGFFMRRRRMKENNGTEESYPLQ